MTIFAVIETMDQSPQLETAIAQHFPSDHIKITNCSWFLSSDGTSKEVSDKLGVSDGKTEDAIIIVVPGDWGRARSDIPAGPFYDAWEWMKAKLETSHG